METTNPAGRLHKILTKAKQSGGSPFGVWSRVFELQDYKEKARNPDEATWEANIEVTSRILQVKQLIDDTEESLRRIEGLSEKYFRPFQRIRPLIFQSLQNLNSGDLGPTMNQITEGDMTVLEFCSEKLEELHAEPVVNEDELKEILQDVNALFNEVRSAAIDPELKSFVLDGLETIRRGLNEFRIRGPERLKETIADVLANYMVNQRTPQTPEEEASLDKFNKAFARFVSLVTLAANAKKLIDLVVSPLLIGPGQSPPDATTH